MQWQIRRSTFNAGNWRSDNRKSGNKLNCPSSPRGTRRFPWANLPRANQPRAKSSCSLAADQPEDRSPLPFVFHTEAIHER